MAKIQIKHLDFECDNYITVESCTATPYSRTKHIKIDFYDCTTSIIHPVILDVSTAIRLAKTLRTEINIVKGI
ncbi:hypothetical protein Phi10:1_gp024 [Cellulophaga phage phi10:1]|uniref:Uncharacterized protein n=1 Tax=Cellulophaga phage phi10:1 TaxID=1327981 RepID=S0A0M6_9CAUD|nr:hypothetical protein Phi10:1_gp024 [Cellulophaga phage phi10:1]AGO48365.1 hypothetical protein Phi10:1_gp024 [Cellulophaga phage phi10:1]